MAKTLIVLKNAFKFIYIYNIYIIYIYDLGLKINPYKSVE